MACILQPAGHFVVGGVGTKKQAGALIKTRGFVRVRPMEMTASALHYPLSDQDAVAAIANG
jgi:hypothetical protein